jgi:AraC-like DNA-binding protein
MVGRFRVSRLHLERLEEMGVSIETVAVRAKLPAAWLREERVLLDTEQLFALWTAIAETGPDPLIGLRLGGEERAERYDPIVLASLSSSNFRDAIDRAGRYKQLTCPEEIRLTTRGGEGRVQFKWLEKRAAVPPTLIDLCFSWIVTLGRVGTGARLSPRRVELRRAPAHRKALEAFFGCRVEFEAAADALVFAGSDLDRPFRTHNSELLAVIAPSLEAELANRQAEGTDGDRVRQLVKRLLAGRRPELSDVSRELGLSTRTLQRRLAAEAVTYQQILEEARRELAQHYLKHSDRDLSETAYLLGYEDANSFFRAFQQWEGVSPGRWRDGNRQPDSGENSANR